MNSPTNKRARKRIHTLGFCGLWNFRKRLKRKQLEILTSSRELLNENKSLSPEPLTSLNPFIDAVQSRIFGYIFWRVLIFILIAGVLVNTIHVSKSDTAIDCNLHSLRFYTSKGFLLSSINENKISFGNFIKLQKKWSIVRDLFPEEFEDLRIQKNDNSGPIQLDNIRIPPRSYVTMHFNKSGELEIETYSRDTASQVELTVLGNNASLYQNLDEPLDTINSVDATSASGFKTTFIISQPDFLIQRLSLDSLYFLKYETSEDGVPVRRSSVLDGTISLTEYASNTTKLNLGDTLAVEFEMPVFVQLEALNNHLRLNTMGTADKILAGPTFSRTRDRMDLHPTIFNYWESIIPSEWKNLILTLILSIVTFLFIRQRKDI